MTDHERYLAACHAMQSGVATMMNYDGKDCEPKHLRVGINGSLSGMGALVKLLIDKGILTHAEYLKAIADHMEEEKKKYEKLCSDATGAKVTLV